MELPDDPIFEFDVIDTLGPALELEAINSAIEVIIPLGKDVLDAN